MITLKSAVQDFLVYFIVYFLTYWIFQIITKKETMFSKNDLIFIVLYFFIYYTITIGLSVVQSKQINRDKELYKNKFWCNGNVFESQ